jgi:hypothetical protein
MRAMEPATVPPQLGERLMTAESLTSLLAVLLSRLWFSNGPGGGRRVALPMVGELGMFLVEMEFCWLRSSVIAP